MKKQIVMATTLALVLSSLHCPESQAAAKPKLSKTKLTLTVGKTAKLKVKNYKGTVKWSSNKKKTATVSKKGVVTAKKKGNAIITAKAGKKKLKCKVTVKAAAAKSTQTPEPVTTTSATPAITQNPVVTQNPTITQNPTKTNVPATSAKPSPTPAAPETALPATKDPQQVQALTQMIEKLNANGATVPTDLNDADTYTWSSEGKLTGISWYNCNISGELDFSAFETLQTLLCCDLYYRDNSISKLNISNCHALEELYCYNNNLGTLDVSNCSSLKKLSCSNTKITSLDVSNCPALTFLSCDENNLGSLDVSNCSSLEWLRCN